MTSPTFPISLWAGLAVGANFPLSYEYQYTGEVKTGIHELRDQYAGVLLTATVRVSVVSSSEANIQVWDASRRNWIFWIAKLKMKLWLYISKIIKLTL